MISSESVLAKNMQEIICNNFNNIDINDDKLIHEKIILLEDYHYYIKSLSDPTYRSLETLRPLWQNIHKHNIDINNISLENLPKDIKDKITPNKETPDETKLEQAKSLYRRSLYEYFLPKLVKCKSVKPQSFAIQLKEKLLNEEKNIYLQRTKGKKIIDRYISSFTLHNQTSKPSKNFIYQYDKNKANILLKVAQSLPDGVLVHAYVPDYLWQYFRLSADKNLLIKTTKTYADEDILESGYFEYIGTTSYTNLLGSINTVHTFKEIQNPTDGIYFYDWQNND